MKTKSKIISIVLTLLLVVLASFIILPFLVILINSFKGVRESALFSLSLPSELNWANYVAVTEQVNLLKGYFNSFFISGTVVIIINLFASMAAFIIQRRDSRFLKVVYYAFIMGLIMPVAIVPTIQLMMDLKIHGTYLSIMMYYTAVLLPFSTFLYVGFMKSVPKELDESALMEGCSYFRLYAQIILPLIKPVIITVTIVVMISVWNDFFGPFYLVTDVNKWTLVLMIFKFVTMYSTNWGIVFAFMMMVISPILIIYFFLQKYIIGGLTVGAVKG